MKKIILTFSLIICFVLPLLALDEAEKEKAKKEFQDLKAAFEEEISYPPYSEYTFTDRYWDSDSGREIIAMGKKALPFIIQEISYGKSWYCAAAQRITGVKMRGPRPEDLAEQWLRWWEENKEGISYE
ncbi:MAG: hypothetical protein PHE18_00595 [Candidatus Omnitrophica bacterium]|nr:hypothetical protein [Candidatus Omnitrophota bacterium]MDD5552360.1 hypothetical protein [Candidatus Omnitrophota bacterium]